MIKLKPQSVVLIADASASAEAHWSKIATTITALITRLGSETIANVYVLGTTTRWDVDEWNSTQPFPAHTRGIPSLVAPVMNSVWASRDELTAVIVVGAGAIFDLEDWARTGFHWVLVGVNGEALQSPGGTCPEIRADELAALDEYLRGEPPPRMTMNPSGSGTLTHQWDVDRCGYPLIRVEPINAFVHLFPITKPQFEQFLAGAPTLNRGDEWYHDFLQTNPRLSPVSAAWMDYEKWFATGLFANEAQEYIHWSGASYRAPTMREWQHAFAWMERQAVPVLPAGLAARLAPTAKFIWNKLREHIVTPTLADLALMRNGIIEWVIGANSQWVGMGNPRPQFYRAIHNPYSEFTPIVSTQRSSLRHWGLRPVRTI
jgi:hypothetical protein